jgi:hypothetical protein
MSTPPEQSDYYSRSALATTLDITLKELTQAMLEAGWLRYDQQAGKGKEWTLTSKGDFEGGVYKDSKKFGQYIAWPKSVLTHAVIVELKLALLNASALAKVFGISAKILNKLFADLGWIGVSKKGWVASDAGIDQGGVQQSSDTTGIPYVVWQRKTIENHTLKQHIDLYKGVGERAVVIASDGMASKETNSTQYYRLLSGLLISEAGDLSVANYLYLYGIQYAYQRLVALTGVTTGAGLTQRVVCDFYLPSAGICLFIQRTQITPTQLAEQIELQSLIEKSSLPYIILLESDISALDQSLPKSLLALGLSLY